MYFWSFFLSGSLILGLRGDSVKKTVVKVPTDQWDLTYDVAENSTTTLVRLIVVTRNHEKEAKQLKKKFEQITDPTHPSYENYMSYDEIHEMMLPETAKNGKAIEQWAKKYSVRVASTAYKEFIVIEAAVGEIECLFQTKLYTYRHRTTGQRTLRATEYRLPEIIHHHIAYIEGLTRFPATSTKKKTIVPISAKTAKSNAPIILRIGSGFSKFLFYIQLICADGKQASNSLCGNDFEGFKIELQQDKNLVTREVPIADTNCQVCRNATAINALYCTAFSLSNDSVLCRFFLNNETDISNYEAYQITIQSIFKTNSSDKVAYPSPTEKVSTVTPDVLVSLYNVDDDKNETRNANSRQAVVGFDEYLNLNSFKSFARTYGENFSLTFGKIYGSDYKDKTYDEGETSLDLQYMSAMGSGIPTDYISSPANFDGFLIDFFVQLAFLEYNKTNIVPLVYSISYGADEGELGETYVQICDLQFIKLGLTGKSILVASGDWGISQPDNVCRRPFSPLYPASSPFVTTVGGTQLVRSNDTSNCARSIPQEPNVCLEEIAAYTNKITGCLITTGGGFSQYNSCPTYQNKSVESYLKLTAKDKQLPPLSYFNESNRAYPDISLIAHDYITKDSGNFDLFVGGTSASSPSAAGMFSLINDRRLNQGMKPLGFLNPLLYGLADKHPDAFFDITKGKNNCNESPECCKYGFSAAKQFDLVTGLGSINHGVLMKLLT